MPYPACFSVFTVLGKRDQTCSPFRFHTKIPLQEPKPPHREVQVWTHTECWVDVWFSKPYWLISSKSNNLALSNHCCTSVVLLSFMARASQAALEGFEAGVLHKPCKKWGWGSSELGKNSSLVFLKYLPVMLSHLPDYSSLWHDFLLSSSSIGTSLCCEAFRV